MWVKCSHFTKDKEFFISAWKSIRDEPKISSFKIFVSICYWILILLSTEWRIINSTIFKWSSVALIVVIVVALVLTGFKKKSKTKPKEDNAYDPVSLGTLYFGFAMSLLTIWASEQISGQAIIDWKTFIIAILASLISFISIIAVYNQSLRKFLSRNVTPNLVSLTFMVSLGGFALCILSLPSNFPKTSQTIAEVVMLFGLAWMVTMMLVMFRDVKNDLLSIVVIILLVITGIATLCKGETVYIILGFILMFIAGLTYLVVTGHLHLYGKVG